SNAKGLDQSDREARTAASRLGWVGCQVASYEQAKWLGDELAFKGDVHAFHFTGPMTGMRFMLGHIGAGKPLLERARLGAAFMGGGYRDALVMLDNHWRAADDLMARLGLAQRIRDSVEQTFERWDGKGEPNAGKRQDLLPTALPVTLAG